MEKQSKYEENLKKLWNLIINANVEQKEKIIAHLDQKTINDLRTFKNPYKKPIIQGSKKRLLAFNMLNMTEKYARRFAMTSLIGFIYRMLDEYEPESDYLSENDPKFANPYNRKVKEFIKQHPFVVYNQKLEKESSLKEILRTKAKITKHRIFLLKDDHKNLKEKRDAHDRDTKATQLSIKTHQEHIEELELKLAKKKKFDKKEIDTTADKSAETNQKHVKNNPRTTLTLTEAHNMNVRDIERMIEKLNELVLKLQNDLAEKQQKLQDYDKELQNLTDQIEENNKTFKSLKDDYTLNVIGTKLGRKVKTEHSEQHPLDNIEVDTFEPTEEELDQIANEVKKELNIDKTKEEYNEEIQTIIEAFLNKYFRYNPDEHVRCAYSPNYDDPTRTPLKDENIIERSVIPPDDTFFRWDRYVENNYEPLRQATDDIYCEKSDFEFDIVPLEIFEGETVEEAQNQFDNYKRKYADEFESDVFCATFANHNLLSPWYNNRNVRNFYTEKTEIIKRIIEQNQKDAQMGKKLMGERAKHKKEKISSSELKAFEKYNSNKELEQHGAVPMSELDIHEKTIPRDKEDSTQQEVEVGVHIIKPKKKGRRIRGFAENFKFNIPAEELKEGQVAVKAAGLSNKSDC